MPERPRDDLLNLAASQDIAVMAEPRTRAAHQSLVRHVEGAIREETILLLS
jgi:hypothetical protein